MESKALLENLTFHDRNPYAEPLHVSKKGRILRFTLKPGQMVSKHSTVDSPVYLVVLQGQGYFTNAEGQETLFGPNSLIIFESGEEHSIRADDEELAFVAFLHGTSSWR